MLAAFKDIIRKRLLPYIDVYKVREDDYLDDIGVTERDIFDIYVYLKDSLKAKADLDELLNAETVKDVIDFLYIYWGTRLNLVDKFIFVLQKNCFHLLV